MLFFANCLPCVSIWWYCNSVTYVYLGFIMKIIQSSPTCALYAHVVLRDGAELLRLKKYSWTGSLPVGGHLGRLLPLTMNGNVIQRLCLDMQQKSHFCSFMMQPLCNILHVHIYSYSTLSHLLWSKSDWLHNDVLSCASWAQHCSEMSMWTWTKAKWMLFYESLSIMLALMSLL